MEDSNKNKPNFTGVWIPAEVFETKDLTSKELLLYGIVASYRNGCYLTSEDLEAKIRCKSETRRKSVKHLCELGFITCQKQTNGRLLLKSTLGFQTAQNEPQATKQQKTSNQPTQPPEALETQENGQIQQNSEQVQEQYGDEDINWCFDEWENIIGTPIASRAKQNRYACRNLLKKEVSHNVAKGHDTVGNLLKLVRESKKDQYAPRIADFSDLQSKLNQLLDWAARLKEQKTGHHVGLTDKRKTYERWGLPPSDEKPEEEPIEDDKDREATAQKLRKQLEDKGIL